MSNATLQTGAQWSWWSWALTWLGRTVTGFVALTGWLFVAMSPAVMLLPAGEKGGVDSSFALPNLFVALSIAYYATAAPALCLPLESDSRFRWFLYLECGWVACLLGSVVGLLSTGNLAVQEFQTPISFMTVTIVTAGLFLAPMFVVLLTRAKGSRRLATVVALLVGWLVVQGIGFAAFDQTNTARVEQVKVILPAAALLLAPLLVSLLLPSKSTTRHDATLLVLFAWSFVMIALAIFAFQREYLVPAADAGYANFISLAMAILAGPVFGWLGMPWVDKNRLAWTLCAFAAAVGVAILVTQAPTWDQSPALLKVWATYRGMRL